MADENNDTSTPDLAHDDAALTPPVADAPAPEEDTPAAAPAEAEVPEQAQAPAEAEPPAQDEAPEEAPAPVEETPAPAEESIEAPAAEAAPTDAAEESPAEAQPAAEPEAVAEPEAESAPELPTAVSLGLLPENFVSAVSTELHFYAPEVAALPAQPADEDDEDEQGSEGGSSSRRRNRRRGGRTEGDAPVEQAPARRRAVEVITEPQRIKGSTRLEAKKQRRRDGREAGRRRAVVTEAEFLARREAVDREMIVRSKSGRIQIAVLEDNVLVEHYVARNQDASLIGNVYLGRVQNVLP